MTRWLRLALLACLPALHAGDPASPKPGEFPLRGTEHRVVGEMVEEDYIHRSGVFRTEGTGVLVEFTMPPFGTVSFLNTEADLRDVPLGTRCVFALYPDEEGAFTRAAEIRDEKSLLAKDSSPSDEQQRATEEVRKKHIGFLKDRGIPAFIERVEGKKVTMTLLGDPASVAALFKDEGLDPAKWATDHKRINLAVANEELRTYNPPVDQQGTNVLEYEAVPTDRFGCAGIRWVVQPNLLLEGFRRGRIVRFYKDNWPSKDMPYGESIYPEIFNSETVETDPFHYPFRTDFANPDLPWYRLQPSVFPPLYSAHTIGGELVKVNPDQRSGQFRTDRTGHPVDFTLPPFAAILYRNTEADLADIPLGTRCLFSLHQDANGAFTQASRITDEFTHLLTYRVSYRVDAALLDQGKLLVARHLPSMKDERDIMMQPPDLGRMELAIDDHTRVWKGGQQIKPSDLAPGDDLLFNRTARTLTSQGRCTDIWAGIDTHKAATGQQRTAHQALLKKNGYPAWIESVNGQQLTITLFAASRTDLPEWLKPDPKGRTVYTVPANDLLQPQGTAGKMFVVTRLPEDRTAGTYGCSGMRWLLDAKDSPADYHAGQVIRVLEDPPPTDPK